MQMNRIVNTVDLFRLKELCSVK